MKIRKSILLLLAALPLTFAAACDREGPLERTGEQIDRGAERAGENIERGAERMEDAVERD